MIVIACRFIAEPGEHATEAVGIFWAENWEMMLTQIDEVIDVGRVEYIPLNKQMGGVGFFGPTTVRYPLPDVGESETYDTFAEASLAEITWCDLYDKETIWRPIP